MLRAALQSALVGIATSALALWVRYGRHWWPSTPLDKAAYYITCPACPIDVATPRGVPPTHSAIGFILLSGLVYSVVAAGIEVARRMRRGDGRADI